eukprot:CAMPEP_0175162780 /NCGR_PEP_ID=MMETSP0087-20121206/25345_1 /TAXON_ID=136419 /ORGANISM="Unknown Unknown, Strain D1" /LENGTH=54 /DNA_ID=CAMNT_0016451333 /DNA_START=309 /DNA_END=469 /DNA_ORIENTATION=-
MQLRDIKQEVIADNISLPQTSNMNSQAYIGSSGPVGSGPVGSGPVGSDWNFSNS